MKKIVSLSLCLMLGICPVSVSAEAVQNTAADKNGAENTDAFWEEFLSSGKYESYFTSKDFTPTEYVIYDINDDETPELMMEADSDEPFYYTWLFTREEEEVTLAYEGYGYGQFRYSPTYQAILLPPETKPFSGTAVTSFYALDEKNFEEQFVIIQDMGINYYSDEFEERELSEEERNQYFADIVMFEWKEISSDK